MDFGGALITVLGWAIVALVCGGAAYWLVSAAFEKELAAWEALIGIIGIIAFAGVAIKLSKTIWFLPFLGIIGVAAALITFLPPLLSDKKRREMWIKDLAKYRHALDFDPKNVAAYSFLGDTYTKLGDYDQAVENYRKALELDPTLVEEKQKLAFAMQDKAKTAGNAMFCPRCQTARSAKSDTCPACDRVFSFDETISYNFHHLPKPEQRKYLLAGGGILLLVLFLWLVGVGILAFLVFLVLAWQTVKVLRELAVWKNR
jgi:tetratricopeptide (TPR) repeat protein